MGHKNGRKMFNVPILDVFWRLPREYNVFHAHEVAFQPIESTTLCLHYNKVLVHIVDCNHSVIL